MCPGLGVLSLPIRAKVRQIEVRGALATHAAPMDADALTRLSMRFGEAVVDPSVWPRLMEELCAEVGAAGAVLLQSEGRTADVPRTRSIDEHVRKYFRDGWQNRDVRATRGVPLLLGGRPVVSDQDILSPEEMDRSDYLNEAIRPAGLRWWAVVGFRAGPTLWGLAFQRTPAQGPFDRREKAILARLVPRLTEAATLSEGVGRAHLAGIGNALNLVAKPALAMDRAGAVLDWNADAEALFDVNLHVDRRTLVVADRRAAEALDAFRDRLRATPDTDALPAAPIVVRRAGRAPVVIRILPVDGPARNPFLGARALLVLTEIGSRPKPDESSLMLCFGLSPAEARVAALVATGVDLEAASVRLGIARETARNQLKSVFAKTGTRRQAELVALLSRA